MKQKWIHVSKIVVILSYQRHVILIHGFAVFTFQSHVVLLLLMRAKLSRRQLHACASVKVLISRCKFRALLSLSLSLSLSSFSVFWFFKKFSGTRHKKVYSRDRVTFFQEIRDKYAYSGTVGRPAAGTV